MAKRIFSEEHKRKISFANTGKPSFWKGKKRGPMSEEQKLKVSKNRKGIQAWNKGKSNTWVKGELNNNWKGGITTQDRLERVKFQHTIQKSVFERDDYTCQLCNIKGGDLQVDHIQSWAEYIELRFNMDNCRTLCSSCHYLITFNKPMPKEIKGWGHNLFQKERMQK